MIAFCTEWAGPHRDLTRSGSRAAPTSIRLTQLRLHLSTFAWLREGYFDVLMIECLELGEEEEEEELTTERGNWHRFP